MIIIITIINWRKIMTFVAREEQLSELNEMYNSPSFEMAVIYGRRRVGKTALIKKFIENKPAIYVQGIEATAELNLKYLSDAIMDFQNPQRLNKNFSFGDFRDAFAQVQDLASMQKEKLIFVMDEYPYFAESDRSISSILQYVIDHIYSEYNNVMLILCGSSMSFMEHQVLGYKSPLYGRKTGQFKIRPFDIFDCKKILNRVSDNDLLAYYGITGGIPQYLTFVNQDLTVEENIRRLFLRANAPLQNEPNILLQEELRKPRTYFSILVAIANGKSKPNDIAQAIGVASTSLNPYINNLIDLDILIKKQPIFEKGNRKSVYAFRDESFKFWFKFIAGEQDQIALGRIDGVLEGIMKELPRYLGPVFEQASQDWLWKQKDLPFSPKEIKSWWGPNPVRKRQEEIDVVAVNYDETQAIVGECKWRSADKLSHEMIDTLIERSELLPKIHQRFLYFFTREITNDFLKYAKARNVRVIEYHDFFRK